MPPQVLGLLVTAPDTVLVVLDRVLEYGSWIEVQQVAGCIESSVRLGYLPGVVDGNGLSSAADLLALLDHLNGIAPLPDYATDLDRSGTATSADVLRLIDLLTGAGAYPEFNGAPLPEG